MWYIRDDEKVNTFMGNIWHQYQRMALKKMSPVNSFRISFSHFWKGFSIESLFEMFPFLAVDYELAQTDEPEIIFYSCFDSANPVARMPGGAFGWNMPILDDSGAVRVFVTGENVEPDMQKCDFAISHSAMIEHSNHLRLPMWSFPGYKPEYLIKETDKDWEEVLENKRHFCNFVYSHDVTFRNRIFSYFDEYKEVDSAGRSMNNMDGWCIEKGYDAKLEFLKQYKFTLAVENTVWPGYQTEKLIHPMLIDSIPIYVGDPLASTVFNPSSYVDFTQFTTVREMREYVIELDNDRYLYLDALSSENYRGNVLPEFAQTEKVRNFFNQIFLTALSRKHG